MTIAVLDAGGVSRTISTIDDLKLYLGAAPGGAVAWVDKTITSLSGSSQTLATANAGRKALMLKNGAAYVGVNILGTTASIGGVGTMTLQPYEGVTLVGGTCPLGAITVVGTAAAYLSAFEAT